VPAISTEFHLSDGEIGLLTGLAFPLFYATFGLAIAILADRANRAAIIMVSVTLFSAFTIACGLAQGFSTLFLARIGVGIGEAGPIPAAMSLIGEKFTGPARQLAVAAFGAATSIGFCCVFLLIGHFGQAYDWRSTFYASGLFSLLISALAWAFLRDHRPLRIPSFGLREFDSFRTLLRIRPLRLALLGLALTSASSWASFQWLPLFLTRSLGMSLADVSVFLGLGYGLVNMAGMFSAGWLAAQLRKASVGRPMIMAAVGAALTTIFLVISFLSSSPEVALTGLILMIISSGVQGTIMAFVQEVTPSEHHAKAVALGMFLNNALGLGCGSLAIGFLSYRLGPQLRAEALRTAVLIVGVASGVLAPLCLYLAARAADRAHTPVIS
jgi:MFS family permease